MSELQSVSSDTVPKGGTTAVGKEDVPGKPLCATAHVLDAGARLLQDFTPIKNFAQHVCTWAIFSHDMERKIETHHYASRLNEDVVQCIVYDSDAIDARLIGVEYIISERLFQALPDEEQKLWHSHFYEIKTGLWINPGVPEVAAMPELEKLANTYGKFWCTWQFDRGDRLPLGPPALMMSPQNSLSGRISSDLIKARDDKYTISTSRIAETRKHIAEPETHPLSDYWMKSNKGWAVDLKQVAMSLPSGHPLSNLH